MLIDEAHYSLDIQYYLWYGDDSGELVFRRVMDAAIKAQTDTPPIVSGFIGLHSKASVVDRTNVYIGSFNLDPRARDYNTEMGVLINNSDVAEELAQLAEELMQPQNSWQVSLMMRASSHGSQVKISGPDNQPRVSGSGSRIGFSSCFPANTFKL